MTYVSATADIGTVSFDEPSNTVTWDIGSLAATGTYVHSLTINVTANEPADPAINTATVSCFEPDIDPATDTAMDETVILPPE